jgi:[ribosomal protein S5]-alanine N-acetyltransferase
VVTVRLVTFSVGLLDAEAGSTTGLCAMLGVTAPNEWPPLFFDEGVRRWFRNQLLADPYVAPWLGHYVIAEVAGVETLVGTAGYKGYPDAEGRVEIGYAIVSAYQRMGIGSAMVGLMLRQAFDDPRVQRVVAETPEDFAASRRLLETTGFEMVGRRDDPDDGPLLVYAVERG